MQKKSAIGIFAILAVAVFVASASFRQQVSSMTDTFPIHGEVCFVVERNTGTTESWCKHNTVTNLARNQTRDVEMNRSYTGYTGNTTWQNLTLSTDTSAPAVTDSTPAAVVTGNGFASVNGDAFVENTTAAGCEYIYHKFTATASQSINKVYLTNNTLAMADQCLNSPCSTATTLNTNENMTVYYNICHS
jgi:hypothetical protein